MDLLCCGGFLCMQKLSQRITAMEVDLPIDRIWINSLATAAMDYELMDEGVT